MARISTGIARLQRAHGVLQKDLNESFWSRSRSEEEEEKEEEEEEEKEEKEEETGANLKPLLPQDAR